MMENRLRKLKNGHVTCGTVFSDAFIFALISGLLAHCMRRKRVFVRKCSTMLKIYISNHMHDHQKKKTYLYTILLPHEKVQSHVAACVSRKTI